jgi:hypothetical protein
MYAIIRVRERDEALNDISALGFLHFWTHKSEQLNIFRGRIYLVANDVYYGKFCTDFEVAI